MNIKNDQREIKVSLGNHTVAIMIKESATNDEAALAIVDAINNDPDCPCCVFIDDKGTICQEPVEVFELRCPEVETLDNFKIRHGLADKKGRRRGQRCMDFPRR